MTICGVSRASLFTGQWMSRHGNRGFAPFQTPWAETYPGLLRANGLLPGAIRDVTVWIERGTLLVRRIEYATQFETFRTEKVTQYAPAVGVQLSDDELRFGAPEAT